MNNKLQQQPISAGESNAPAANAKPKIVITTTMIVVQGIFLILLSFGILWAVDHFFHTHHVSALVTALTPTLPALKLGALLAVPFFIVFEFTWVLRFKLGVQGENTENFLKKTGLVGQALLALASGTGEEVLFRGTLQALFGVWASAVVFALMHCTGKKSIPYVINCLIMGLTLSGIFIWSGNLWAGIVVHILNNFLCFVFAKRFRALFGCKVDDSGETMAS